MFMTQSQFGRTARAEHSLPNDLARGNRAMSMRWCVSEPSSGTAITLMV